MVRSRTAIMPATGAEQKVGGFNNVELVTAEKIGIETTTYVRNIFKYYTSYKLSLDALQERKAVREQAIKK